MSVTDIESVRDMGPTDPIDGTPFLKHELRHPDVDHTPLDELDFAGLDADSELFGMDAGAYEHNYLKPSANHMPIVSPSQVSPNQVSPGHVSPSHISPYEGQHADLSGHFPGQVPGQGPGHIPGQLNSHAQTQTQVPSQAPNQVQGPVQGQMQGHASGNVSGHVPGHVSGLPGHSMASSLASSMASSPAQHSSVPSQPAISRSAQAPHPGKPLFTVDLPMIRRTMEGVNAVLGVDLGGTEVGESALLDSPSENGDEDSKESGSSKAEMSHVRLISDACGYITASVSRAVLQAAEESMQESRTLGVSSPRPKPPIRKKRGGILGFKELAQRANLSPWHFHRVFRFVTGVTPKAYGEALWEYLMIETGFDLENEEMTINLAVQTRGPLEASKVANNMTTPSSNSSSPSSPSSQLDPLAAQPLPSSSISSTVVAPERGRSSTVSSQSAFATAVANGSDAVAPVGPHGGQMAPGRVRKTSSRSRGARSRSRTRSSSQSRVLANLSIEPADPGTALPVGTLPPRGRSFSRMQRPVLGPGPAGANASSVGTQTPSSHEHTLTPSQQQPPEPLIPEGIIPEEGGPEGLLLGPSPRQGTINYDIPDMNTLSLQQQQQELPIDGLHHTASVPTFSPLATQDYFNAYPSHQGARHSDVGSVPGENGQSLHSELLDGYGGPMGLPKGHHRRQSAGNPADYAHIHNRGLAHGQPAYGGSYNLSMHGSSHPSYQGQRGSGDSRGMMPSNLLGDNIGHGGTGLHHQLYAPVSSTSTVTTLVPDHGSTSSGTPLDEPTFQEDLQREMYGAIPDDTKNDQLSDLPTSFYTDLDDKSLYGEPDEFTSALIGLDDPPLAMPWGDANTDTYTY